MLAVENLERKEKQKSQKRSERVGGTGKPTPAIGDPEGGRNRGASASSSFFVVLV